MPNVQANGLSLYYEQQGSGEPLILIPYLAADHACYAFQVPEYAKHFTCISLDLRGTGESDKPQVEYTTATLADDVAGFMAAMQIERAHIAGLSLGAAVGMWLAAKYPEKVQSLSLHSPWHKTDAYCKAVVDGWQIMARALNSVPEMVILGILPVCFTPELYDAQPDFIASIIAFVRSRPAQTVEDFMRQSNAVLAHDVSAQLARITAPTQITFGAVDQVTSTRFAAPLSSAIRNSELVVFEGCSHAALYEKVAEFNQRTLEFLLRQTESRRARSA